MNKIILFIILIVVGIVTATKWHQLDGYNFEKYKSEFHKRYLDPSEEEFRRGLFEKELARVKLHNADNTKTWKEGVNRFSDQTKEEFGRLLGLKKSMLYASKTDLNQEIKMVSELNLNEYPNEVDWRQKGIITAVKDQGQCGSCWTFGSTETIESYLALSNGLLSDLSEQQILDCTPNPNQCGGTGGCAGGTAELAFARINQMGGITTEWIYPYTSYEGSNFKCNNATLNPVATVTNYTTLPTNQYDPLFQHIANVGPLSISVDASSWNAYESGVYNGCNQTNPDIDHAVQLVGYGTDSESGLDYWLVRNSWNPSWGEAGYIRLARSTNTECGIDLTPQDGTECKGGPPTVQVCGTCGILFDTSFPDVASLWAYE